MATTIKILAIGLAGVLLYAALRGLDWQAFLATLSSLNPAWAVLCLVFELAALLARAVRWDMLLAYQATPRLLVAYIGEAIGDVGNTFLPARAGEPMRAFFVARQLKVSAAFVIGTAAVERVSDAVFVSLIAFLMILLLPHTPAWLTGIAMVFFALGIVVLAMISLLPSLNKMVIPLLIRQRYLKPLLDRIETIVTGIWQGSQALLGHPRRIAMYSVLTLIFWSADGIAILCLAKAMATLLSFPEAMLFLAALGLSSAIPATPGYIGIFQFVAVSVLAPFGVSRAQALAIVLVYQLSGLLLQLVSAAMGSWALTRSAGPKAA